MTQWIKAKATGVRYRQHDTRKHGVNFDRYFTIRYNIAGKEKSEGLGWASEGWTERKAATVLAELKANHTTGQGPNTLAEKRENKRQEEAEEQQRKQKEKVKNATFNDIWTTSYFPFIEANRKSVRAIETEGILYKKWIEPVIGNLPLGKVATIPHIEILKKNMKAAKKSPRTIRYALNVIRQVYTMQTEKISTVGEIRQQGSRFKDHVRITGETDI